MIVGIDYMKRVTLPRPRTIPPNTRLQIYLVYRQRQKIYPVAKQFGISRSAVTWIINEFLREGFSPAPRTSLSPELLRQVQELHLADVIREFGEFNVGGALRRPEARMGLSVAAALEWDKNEGSQDIGDHQLSPAVRGHLKGTEASHTIDEGLGAITHYKQKCLSLWHEVRSWLEESTVLPVQVGTGDDAPAIYPQLVDLLYDIQFMTGSRGDAMRGDNLKWIPGGAEVSALSLQVAPGGELTQVAYGSTDDHTTVEKAVETFLNSSAGSMAEQGRELLGAYDDLLYLDPILKEALARVSTEDIRQRVCPACPYPELLLDNPKHDAETSSGDQVVSSNSVTDSARDEQGVSARSQGTDREVRRRSRLGHHRPDID